jgi:hypothetical protein
MRKNSLKNACNVAMRHGLGHKTVRVHLTEKLGKYKFLLIVVISFVLGMASIFMFGK